jgi:hypothetical protein
LRKLLRLKEWLTIPEAAEYLSILSREEVCEADVFTFARNGHLTLSVRFVNNVAARCGPIVTFDEGPNLVVADDDQTSDGGRNVVVTLCTGEEIVVSLDDPKLDISHLSDWSERLSAVKDFFATKHSLGEGKAIKLGEIEYLDGVWDLTMLGSECDDVEHAYQNLTNRLAVEPTDLEGAVVRREEGFACVLAGGLPPDSVFVVRAPALQELETRISNLDKPAEKPLERRERTTLLVIIAALAEMAKIDLRNGWTSLASSLARQESRRSCSRR